MIMYESVTSYLSDLDAAAYGRWHVGGNGDGSYAHPFRLPFVEYSSAVSELQTAILQFVTDHEALGLRKYEDILASAGLEWGYESMKHADAAALDGTAVMALLVGAVRAERFSDGTFLSFCEDGCVTRWLIRLREIDDESSAAGGF